jgi:hypothetical protein
MYEEYRQVFEKLMKYLVIAREFKDDIKEVYVYNSIELHFGKKYCRIYVEIKLNDEVSMQKRYELQELHYKYFNNVGHTNYFSYYLGYDDYETIVDRLRNREEEMHYNYIWNFLAWQLERDNIKVKSENFISQYELKIKRKADDEKWEKEKEKINNEINPFLKQDILFAIKHYDRLKIGKIVAIKPYDCVSLLEIKKDLSIGKVKTDVRTYDTYAIINPSLLSKSITKDELLKLIEAEDDFEGLEWKKPKNNI